MGTRYFLRFATPGLWDGLADPTAERRQQARGNFRLADRGGHLEEGLSLYEISNHADRDAVVSAISCDRLGRGNKPRPVNFLEIDGEEIGSLGIVVATPGDTALLAARGLHRELQWDQARLDALADRLLDRRRSITTVSRETVEAHLRALSPDALDPADPGAREALRAFQATPRKGK